MSHKAPGPRPFSLGIVYAAYLALALFFMRDLNSASRLWIQFSRGWDFLYYYCGAKLFSRGVVDIYEPLPLEFTNTLGSAFLEPLIPLNHPPTAYFLLEPLSRLPFFDAYLILELTTYLTGFVGLYWLHRCLGYAWIHSLCLSILAYLAMFHTAMNLDNLCLGQMGLLLLTCYTASFALHEWGKPGAAGLFVALAITAKAWPLTLLGFFVVPGHRRTLYACVGWLAAFQLAEMAAHGPRPFLTFLSYSQQKNWVAITTSQSVFGYCRMYWKLEFAQAQAIHLIALVLVSLVVVGLWWRVQPRLSSQDRVCRLFFFGSFGLLGCLFAPHSCPHHLLWLWTLVAAYFFLLRDEELLAAAAVSALPLLVLLFLDGEVHPNYALRLYFHSIGGGFYGRLLAFVSCLAWGLYLARQGQGTSHAHSKSGS